MFWFGILPVCGLQCLVVCLVLLFGVCACVLTVCLCCVKVVWCFYVFEFVCLILCLVWFYCLFWICVLWLLIVFNSVVVKEWFPGYGFGWLLTHSWFVLFVCAWFVCLLWWCCCGYLFGFLGGRFAWLLFDLVIVVDWCLFDVCGLVAVMRWLGYYFLFWVIGCVWCLLLWVLSLLGWCDGVLFMFVCLMHLLCFCGCIWLCFCLWFGFCIFGFTCCCLGDGLDMFVLRLREARFDTFVCVDLMCFLFDWFWFDFDWVVVIWLIVFSYVEVLLVRELWLG